MGNQPFVSVLMASYNHAPYLGEQIDSVLAQTWDNWALTVSDNGSTDGSVEILKRYEKEHPGRVQVVQGPGNYPDNHFSLMKNANPTAAYYVWSDSDDAWLPNRLARAVEMMAPHGQETPVFYCGRSILMDVAGHDYGLSPLRDKIVPNFANALVQGLGFGHTMAFNRPGRELIALGLGRNLVVNDWWPYIIVSGVGGSVIYDSEPTVRYRQHGHNGFGSDRGVKAKLSRLTGVLDGKFHRWTEANLAVLAENRDRLTPENQEVLRTMISLHKGEGTAMERLRKVRYGGFRRQSPWQSAFLYLMALMKWL